MKKRLVLIAGNIGVGKTTIARKIAERMNGLHIDVDDFKRDIVDPSRVTNEIDDESTRRQYYLAALEHIVRQLSVFDTVVMDEIFHVRQLREEIEEYCHSRGIGVVWIHVRVSEFGIVQRRLLAKAREGHILTTEQALFLYNLFEGVWEDFDPEKENVHIIMNNDDDNLSPVDSILASVS